MIVIHTALAHRITESQDGFGLEGTLKDHLVH